MNRTVNPLLDEVLFFLKTERKLYGDWNRQPEIRPAIQGRESDGPQNVRGNQIQPGSNDKTGKSDGKMNSDNRQMNTTSKSGSSITKTEKATEKSAPSTSGALENCQTLEELRTLCEVEEVLKSDLPGTNLVFGDGNPDADLLLIGEAPGAREDELGIPFVGRSGKLLDKIMEAIGFSRKDIYIANILKHRPPDNRNPTADERQRSLPYLLKQIDIIKPRLILCLGTVSATTMLGRSDSLTNMRGIFHPFGDYELLVTYHPAALLRNPNWKRPAWDDVQLLKKRYDELGCKP